MQQTPMEKFMLGIGGLLLLLLVIGKDNYHLFIKDNEKPIAKQKVDPARIVQVSGNGFSESIACGSADRNAGAYCAGIMRNAYKVDLKKEVDGNYTCTKTYKCYEAGY